MHERMLFWEYLEQYLCIRTCRRWSSLSWRSGISSPISINSCLSFPFTPSSCSHLTESRTRTDSRRVSKNSRRRACSRWRTELVLSKYISRIQLKAWMLRLSALWQLFSPLSHIAAPLPFPDWILIVSAAFLWTKPYVSSQRNLYDCLQCCTRESSGHAAFSCYRFLPKTITSRKTQSIFYYEFASGTISAIFKPRWRVYGC